ncbi:hypothetical protein QBC38DRAFT_488578 [Podospora fimiseda]|uniref:Uncharacterized protein n=1 Tax=Podospora fimiseda TaxID=252190 RepID=A0AAN7BG33_9PEZI|nr:hypothetical protein QBC38DRAFT_488578 [Podospora fimiseda]
MVALFPLFVLISVTAVSDVPASATVQEDNGQVTVNPDPTANDTVPPDLPITVTIFSDVPGPSKCRSNVVLRLDIPHPSVNEDGKIQEGERKCWNTLQQVGCGNLLQVRKQGARRGYLLNQIVKYI